jgi:hypothetical protein
MKRIEQVVVVLFVFLVCLVVVLLYSNGRSSKTYVTAHVKGGFANRIFQILAGLQYAEKHKKQFVLCKNYIDKNSHEPDDLYYSIQRLFPNIPIIETLENITVLDYTEKQFEYVNPPYIQGNVLLRGVFQSEKNFPSRLPSVRTSYYPNVYFLHIRGGDYLQKENANHYIPLESYYKRCIAHILEQSPNARFLVCTNDKPYANKILQSLPIHYTISEKVSAYDTLVEMSNCCGGICANSSLSWLGAFFQRQPRGILCMPSKWIHTTDNTDDLYPVWATRVKV